MILKNKEFKLSNFLKLILFSLVLTTFSCNNNKGVIVENYKDFENGIWEYDSVSVFDFNIEDINSTYNVFCNIRSTLDYQYYNIYVKYELLDHGGKLIRANMQEANLMEPKTGKPYGAAKPLGNAAANVYTSSHPLLDKIKFDAPGVYRLSIKQYMRNNNLEGIYGVGILVKKQENQ